MGTARSVAAAHQREPGRTGVLLHPVLAIARSPRARRVARCRCGCGLGRTSGSRPWELRCRPRVFAGQRPVNAQGGVWVPGGPHGLQNRWSQHGWLGGFDSRPPPPAVTPRRCQAAARPRGAAAPGRDRRRRGPGGRVRLARRPPRSARRDRAVVRARARPALPRGATRQPGSAGVESRGSQVPPFLARPGPVGPVHRGWDHAGSGSRRIATPCSAPCWAGGRAASLAWAPQRVTASGPSRSTSSAACRQPRCWQRPGR